jgi:hypothetical protein
MSNDAVAPPLPARHRMRSCSHQNLLIQLDHLRYLRFQSALDRFLILFLILWVSCFPPPSNASIALLSHLDENHQLLY